jgi:hypothetical protein
MNKAVSFGREVPGEQVPEAGGVVRHTLHNFAHRQPVVAASLRGRHRALWKVALEMDTASVGMD